MVAEKERGVRTVVVKPGEERDRDEDQRLGIAHYALTVQEAAQHLGVEEEVIRERIENGTLQLLEARRKRDPDRVVLPPAEFFGAFGQDSGETSGTLAGAKDETKAELRERVVSLERQLEARTEELRLRDALLVQVLDRVPWPGVR